MYVSCLVFLGFVLFLIFLFVCFDACGCCLGLVCFSSTTQLFMANLEFRILWLCTKDMN